MYYLYVIKSRINSRLYRGITDNLRKRLLEHNKGKVKSTKAFRPWDLIYYEGYLDKMLARKSELFYKTGQGRRQLKKKLGID